MNSSAKLVVTCYLLLTSCAGHVWCKTYVEMLNNLSANTTLTVHCKSKHEDLGVQYITTIWGFGLETGTKWLVCYFSWPSQFHRFDIYNQERDGRACDLCVWKISPDAPCKFDMHTGDYTDCYPWKPVRSKPYVEIFNSLPVNTTLIVHCKSKQDDLGVQYITTIWGFDVKTHLYGKKLFVCDFSWPSQFHQFDVYNQKRDEGACDLCVWKISPNGPCRFDMHTGDYTACYPWKPPTQMGRKPLM